MQKSVPLIQQLVQFKLSFLLKIFVVTQKQGNEKLNESEERKRKGMIATSTPEMNASADKMKPGPPSKKKATKRKLFGPLKSTQTRDVYSSDNE